MNLSRWPGAARLVASPAFGLALPLDQAASTRFRCSPSRCVHRRFAVDLLHAAPIPRASGSVALIVLRLSHRLHGRPSTARSPPSRVPHDLVASRQSNRSAFFCRVPVGLDALVGAGCCSGQPPPRFRQAPPLRGCCCPWASSSCLAVPVASGTVAPCCRWPALRLLASLACTVEHALARRSASSCPPSGLSSPPVPPACGTEPSGQLQLKAHVPVRLPTSASRPCPPPPDKVARSARLLLQPRGRRKPAVWLRMCQTRYWRFGFIRTTTTVILNRRWHPPATCALHATSCWPAAPVPIQSRSASALGSGSDRDALPLRSGRRSAVRILPGDRHRRLVQQ